jgi:hypothetical protein
MVARGKRAARNPWLADIGDLPAPRPGCEKTGSHINQGCRSLRSLHPWLPSLHPSGVLTRPSGFERRQICRP